MEKERLFKFMRFFAVWRKSFGKNTTSISKYKGIEYEPPEVIKRKILELEKEIIDTLEKMEH